MRTCRHIDMPGDLPEMFSAVAPAAELLVSVAFTSLSRLNDVNARRQRWGSLSAILMAG
jgi:hypothetical protein